MTSIRRDHCARRSVMCSNNTERSAQTLWPVLVHQPHLRRDDFQFMCPHHARMAESGDDAITEGVMWCTPCANYDHDHCASEDRTDLKCSCSCKKDK